MEAFFVLPPMEQWENIKRTIDECDIYVTILGDRYGSTSIKDCSFTELECEYAAKVGKPIVALVQKKHKILSGHWTSQPKEHREKQKKLQETIACNYKYYWGNIGELIHAMFEGILNVEREYDLVGLGRPIPPVDISDKTEPVIHAHFEFSENTTRWNKELYRHEYNYRYDDKALRLAVDKIVKKKGTNAETAIYSVVKHAILKQFVGKDVVINGLYLDDADVLYAIKRMGL